MVIVEALGMRGWTFWDAVVNNDNDNNTEIFRKRELI